MPRAWSAKDERQYEHIKGSELEEGRGTKRAKALAAATVNKRRASEGRTTSAGARRRGGKKTAGKKASGRKTTRKATTMRRGRKRVS